MRIEVKPIKELAPAKWNPRKISDEAMRGLQASVERFGLVEPIIWNEKTGHVVGGHQRLAVLKARGEVATHVVVVDMPESEEKALNVALNNPHIAGEFTEELDAILADLKVDNEEMFKELRLDCLVHEPAIPPSDFPEVGDDIQTDYKCPMCGYEWSGKPK